MPVPSENSVLQGDQSLMHQIEGVVDQPSSVFTGHGAPLNSATVLGIPKPRVRSAEHGSAHRQRFRTIRKRAQKTTLHHWDLAASCLMSCLNPQARNQRHPRRVPRLMQDWHKAAVKMATGIRTLAGHLRL